MRTALGLAHRWVSRRLSAYLDGELAGRAAQWMARHVARCAACAEALEGLRRAQAALRAAPRSAPPAEAWDRLRERMAAPARADGLPAPRRRLLRHRWVPAAAGLLMALGAAIYLAYDPGQPAPQGDAAAVAALTAADLVQQESVPLSPSLELLLVASHNGGANPREDRR